MRPVMDLYIATMFIQAQIADFGNNGRTDGRTDGRTNERKYSERGGLGGKRRSNADSGKKRDEEVEGDSNMEDKDEYWYA